MGQLSENKLFETEVRFFIKDEPAFRQLVSDLDGELLREYAFTDHYYMPQHQTWDLATQSLRIRVWRQPQLPTAIWLTKQEVVAHDGFAFKRSLYPEGKRQLFEGSLSDCQEVLSDLGYEQAFSITKNHGWVWQVPALDLEFCLEDVDGLGWSGEFELAGDDLEKITQDIKRHQKYLQLADDQLSSQPLAVMYNSSLTR